MRQVTTPGVEAAAAVVLEEARAVAALAAALRPDLLVQARAGPPASPARPRPAAPAAPPPCTRARSFACTCTMRCPARPLAQRAVLRCAGEARSSTLERGLIRASQLTATPLCRACVIPVGRRVNMGRP
jgi:hypothetical protein